MCETCSVLGKVWKTISVLISQQQPNMRSCFEPADRETHCWLSMIGTDEWFNHFVLTEDSASSAEICFESQVFEAGARSPQLELDKWDEDWSCEVFLTKCRPLVRDTPLARWFRLFLKLGLLSVKVERGNLSRQIHECLLPQLGIQTIKNSGWQGVGSLWRSKNLPSKNSSGAYLLIHDKCNVFAGIC